MLQNRLIDTHTHLDFDRFDTDRDDVIRRAKESHVGAMITIGIDYRTSLRAIEIAEQHDNVFASVGVHPHDAKTFTDEQAEHICDLLNHPKVVAIGEIGLDYHYDYSPRDVQRRVLRHFLDLSLETQMPSIIHTREADEDILSLIREKARSGWQGVFHCFSGDQRMGQDVLELGFLLSFTGNITFKKSPAAQVMQTIPLEKIMIETDCPFMAPVPHRGKRNEPAYVRYVAEKVADVKQVSLEEVARITTGNAVDVFQLRLEEESLWP